MEGKDPHDQATGICAPASGGDYSSNLKLDALKGVRIGIARAYIYEPTVPPGSDMPVGGLNATRAKAMSSAIALLKTAGATVIDPVEIPSIVATDPNDNALLFGICYDLERGKGNDENCSVILKYGMKRDFNKWLDSLGESAPVASLTELRNFNTAHQAAGAIRYGQAQLDISDQMDVEAYAARFRADRDKDLRLARTQGLDVALRKHELDALLMPSWFGEELLNKAGYPAVIVPYTTIPNDLSPAFP